MALVQQNVNGELTDNAVRLIRQELALGGLIQRSDAAAAVDALTKARAEVARLTAVLAEWEHNQRAATEDAYDEGYTEATAGRPHRNTAAILAVLADEERD